MKKVNIINGLLFLAAVILMTSCGTPVTLTSWKNPKSTAQVSKVVVMPLFDKLEYTKPFEQAMVSYFGTQGLKSLGCLDFLNPSVKYPINEVKRLVDSVGADGVLVFNYKGTDQTQNYVPPTYYGGGWGGGYWGGGYWGGGFYGGGVATGGYWTTTSVVNLKASLYVKQGEGAVWTADITVTDPNYVDQAANSIAQQVYADWQKNGLLKFQGTTK
jgi:hypothetical protein